jgi:hypothetical protein
MIRRYRPLQHQQHQMTLLRLLLQSFAVSKLAPKSKVRYPITRKAISTNGKSLVLR